jgi:hypothetical protein
MIIADLPPQITLACHGDRSGGLRGSAPFNLTIYVDVPRRRFVTAPSPEFGWPTHGNLKSVTTQKIVLWNISEKIHPGLHSWAEFDIGSRRYVGRISYNARALIDEKYSGTCVVKPGVPAPIRRLLLNA